MFSGRKNELETLRRLRGKNTSSLVCILGRRRIGKSALVQQFGKEFPNYFSVQGLGPDKNVTNVDQLEHFGLALKTHFKIKKPNFTDWTEALYKLGELASSGSWLILLDEISWMGKSDFLFSAKLKDAWDLVLKRNPKLILVLCGSVSSWIEENILLNINFVGRVSCQIQLQELSLPEMDDLWQHVQKGNVGLLEKMLVLSVTGGVPKYIEEVVSTESLEKNLIKLCFTSEGILFSEFEKIFEDILGNKSLQYRKIIELCMNAKLSPLALSKKLKIGMTGDFIHALHILDISGFLSRDYYFDASGKVSKFSHLRVKDNYLRFYLNHIAPLKNKILRGGKVITSLWDLKNFESVMGYQFENLILHNRQSLYPMLDLLDHQIESAAPFIQRKTTTNKGACQIDLLIHTKMDLFYLCEFKCKKRIGAEIVREVEKKMNTLKLPKRSALKPVLVYLGEIDANTEDKLRNYFYKLISFEEFFKT